MPDNDHTGRPKTGCDRDSKPLAVGEFVNLPCTVKTMESNGRVTLDVVSSDGIHHYTVEAHCHCCVKP